MFNLEADIIARIESLELEVRSVRRRVEHVANPSDRRVLDHQIGESIAEIKRLREQLTPRAPRVAPIKLSMLP